MFKLLNRSIKELMPVYQEKIVAARWRRIRQVWQALTCTLFLLSASNLETKAITGQDKDGDLPTMQYDEIFDSGSTQTGSLLVVGEAALRAKRYDRAIEFAKRALDNDNQEIDVHKLYAQALEGKFKQQKSQDLDLLKECVQEWLLVMRTGVGEEKGINIGGAGIGDFLYRDSERYILAQQHLLKLTGTAPHMWESNKRYLKRALKPMQLVKGKIISKQIEPQR
jgi:tetratricopeptide (TPR) repeat protein